ncbi:hypothetical protein BKH44_03840 [Helicobacter sp. 13S00477-4]|nr:hypothetical protein BKH44_03840 [Helicobacter sp. 13S00477-4]
MIAELQEYYSSTPLQSGGYFFDTAPNTNPFISFRQRFPSLDSIMTNAPQWYGVPLNPSDTSFMIATRVAFSTTQSILPNFTWSLSAPSTNRSDILAAIRTLLDQRPGTIWIGLMTYTHPDGSISRHALPILRSSAGLKVIPTNTTTMSLFEFTDTVSDTTDPELVFLRLSNRETRTLTEFATLQLTGTFQEPLSVTFSQNNCTGEGEDRRGSGASPSSTLVNQCESGRCAYPK